MEANKITAEEVIALARKWKKEKTDTRQVLILCYDDLEDRVVSSGILLGSPLAIASNLAQNMSRELELKRVITAAFMVAVDNEGDESN